MNNNYKILFIIIGFSFLKIYDDINDHDLFKKQIKKNKKIILRLLQLFIMLIIISITYGDLELSIIFIVLQIGVILSSGQMKTKNKNHMFFWNIAYAIITILFINLYNNLFSISNFKIISYSAYWSFFNV